MNDNAFDEIAMLLNDEERRSREDALAVENLFAIGMADSKLFDLNATHDVCDIPLGLGWRWDSPVVMNEDICDVVGKAARTSKRRFTTPPVVVW